MTIFNGQYYRQRRQTMLLHDIIAADMAKQFLTSFLSSRIFETGSSNYRSESIPFEQKFMTESNYAQIIELGYFLSLHVLVGSHSDGHVSWLAKTTGTRFPIGPISPSLARYVFTLTHDYKDYIRRIFFSTLIKHDLRAQSGIDQLHGLFSKGESNEVVGAKILYGLSAYAKPGSDFVLYQIAEHRIRFSVNLYAQLSQDQSIVQNHLDGLSSTYEASHVEEEFVGSLKPADKWFLSYRILQTGNLPLFFSMEIGNFIDYLSLFIDQYLYTIKFFAPIAPLPLCTYSKSLKASSKFEGSPEGIIRIIHRDFSDEKTSCRSAEYLNYFALVRIFQTFLDILKQAAQTSSDDLLEHIPDLKDPISHECIKIPVKINTGVCYDRSSLEDWFNTQINERKFLKEPIRSRPVIPWVIYDTEFLAKMIDEVIQYTKTNHLNKIRESNPNFSLFIKTVRERKQIEQSTTVVLNSGTMHGLQ